MIFKALQDETRRSILDLLKERDLTAGDIAEHFSMSKPSISYHLDLLRQAGLVSSKKEGQFITYTLETTVLDESIGWLAGLIQKGKKHAHKTSLAGNRTSPGSLRGLGGSLA